MEKGRYRDAYVPYAVLLGDPDNLEPRSLALHLDLPQSDRGLCKCANIPYFIRHIISSELGWKCSSYYLTQCSYIMPESKVAAQGTV